MSPSETNRTGQNFPNGPTRESTTQHQILTGLFWIVPLALFFGIAILDDISFSGPLMIMGFVFAGYSGLLFSTFSTHPEDIFELDKIFVLLFGYYVILPFVVNSVHPEIMEANPVALDPISESPRTVICLLLALVGITA